MRIVAGIYKNKNIVAPSGEHTRPTSDKTRESIFNIIAPYIVDSNVLDIFSGSGALGLEALSRGAKKVTLIDNDINAINCIKENINNLKANDKVKVIQDDYKVIKSLNEKFDVILFDPPYKLEVFDEIFNLIKEHSLLNEYGVIVYESNKENSLTGEYDGFKLKVYKYGIAFVNVLFKL